MKHKNTSKLTILSCLFFGTIANAQNFYTCVPKKSSLKKMIIEDDFKTAESLIDDEVFWSLIITNRTLGSLPAGIYKVVVAGGSGGNGGDAGEVGGYGYGGRGEIKKQVFYHDKLTSYAACIGSHGEIGEYGTEGGSGGGGGAGSAFKTGAIHLLVSGGGGGGGDSHHGGGGGGGGGYGCGVGGTGGYGNDYGTRGAGGSITGGVYLDGAAGADGIEDSGDNGGPGGAGGSRRACANGGAGGTGWLDGINGNSCASVGNGNSGDGYVKIYKYIG